MRDENNKNLLTMGEFGKIVEEFKKAYANGPDSCNHEELLNKLLKIEGEEDMNNKKTGLFTNPEIIDDDFGFGPLDKEKYKKREGSFEDDLREKLKNNLKSDDKLISYGESVSKFVEMLVEYYRNLLKSNKKYVDLLKNENKLLAEKVNFLENRAEEYESVIEMLTVDKNLFSKKKECCSDDFSLTEMYEKLFDNNCPTLENMRKEKQNKDKKGLKLGTKKVLPDDDTYKKELKED